MADSQQWAFPQGFPYPFLRLSLAHGSNTVGTLAISFLGYSKDQTVPQTVVLFNGPIYTDANSAFIASSNYSAGMILAVWSGQDQDDAVLTLQGSADAQNWGNLGGQADDVGSVTINTSSPTYRQIKTIPPLQASIQGTIPVTVNSIKPVKNPAVFNTATSATPNTETNFTVGPIKRVEIANRGNSTVKLSYVSGQSGTQYVSILPGNTYPEENIDDQTIIYYVQSAAPSMRLEVVTWD